MSTQQLIFIGFQITNQLRDCFEKCSDRDKVYFEDPNFLETVTIDNCEYVGKRVNNGASPDKLEDTARNVVSLLSRICNNRSLSTDQALIIAAEESPDQPPSRSSESFDYSDLV